LPLAERGQHRAISPQRSAHSDLRKATMHSAEVPHYRKIYIFDAPKNTEAYIKEKMYFALQEISEEHDTADNE